MNAKISLSFLAAGAALALSGSIAAASGPVTVLSVGAEGADSASVDRTKVWNVRKGYNRLEITAVSKATYSGYYRDAFLDAVTIPPTTIDTAQSATIRLECLRNRRDAWYTSRDTSRTMLSNTTRTMRLSINNPARCRISVSMSAYNSGSDFPDPPGSKITLVDATYSLVQIRVQSIR